MLLGWSRHARAEAGEPGPAGGCGGRGGALGRLRVNNMVGPPPEPEVREEGSPEHAGCRVSRGTYLAGREDWANEALGGLE